MFPGTVSEWTQPQNQMASWLRFYNNFYELCKSQSYVTDIEIAFPWMIEYDMVVDAIFEWYDWKSKEKRNERTAQSHEAQVPKATELKHTYRPRHK